MDGWKRHGVVRQYVERRSHLLEFEGYSTRPNVLKQPRAGPKILMLTHGRICARRPAHSS